MIQPKYAIGDRVVVTTTDDTFTGRHATVRYANRRNKPRRFVYALDIDGAPMMKYGTGPYTEDEIAPEETK